MPHNPELYHAALARVPKDLWAHFVEYVKGLSPRRSISEHIVHLIRQDLAANAPAESPPPKRARRKKGE